MKLSRISGRKRMAAGDEKRRRGQHRKAGGEIEEKRGEKERGKEREIGKRQSD